MPQLSEPEVDTTPDPITHVARCAQCDVGAKIRPLASGHGFEVLERYGVDADATFGGGPNNHPLCPHGHGEMSYADEQLPATDAISQVAAQLETKPRLPFPAPAINYEAFFHSIRDKRHDVAKLERQFSDISERRAQIKKKLDEANEQLGTMIQSFEDVERDRLDELARIEARAEAVAEVGAEAEGSPVDESTQPAAEPAAEPAHA